MGAGSGRGRGSRGGGQLNLCSSSYKPLKGTYNVVRTVILFARNGIFDEEGFVLAQQHHTQLEVVMNAPPGEFYQTKNVGLISSKRRPFFTPPLPMMHSWCKQCLCLVGEKPDVLRPGIV